MVDRRSGDDAAFLAEGLSGGTPPEVFGTGRVCIAAQCSVKLSRYNSTNWCALHESPASTQRPYDTSTRQRGRRRNSSAARRASAARVVSGTAAARATAGRSAPTAASASDSGNPDAANPDAANPDSAKRSRRTAA